MPIVVACQCGQKFAAKDHLAGKTVRCPQCQGAIAVPAPAALPVPAPVETAASGVAEILSELGVTADAAGVRCPKCGSGIPTGQVVCARCRYNVQTATYERTERRERTHPDAPRLKDYAGKPEVSQIGNEPLDALELAGCFFCGGIMFVYGLVLLLMGKQRGVNMIVASMLLSMVFAVVAVAVTALVMSGALNQFR